jgi:hypothetical protein
MAPLRLRFCAWVGCLELTFVGPRSVGPHEPKDRRGFHPRVGAGRSTAVFRTAGLEFDVSPEVCCLGVTTLTSFRSNRARSAYRTNRHGHAHGHHNLRHPGDFALRKGGRSSRGRSLAGKKENLYAAGSPEAVSRWRTRRISREACSWM